MQHASAVQVAQRAATGPDRMNLDRWNRDAVAIDIELIGHLHRPVAHQRHVAAGAAHLDRDQIARAGVVAVPADRADARSRSRQHHLHRLGSSLLHIERAAIALHDQQRRLQSETLQPFLERAQVGHGAQADIRVGHHRGAAFVLAHDRRDLGRARHPEPRPFARDQVAHLLFMHAIAKAVQQADCDRLDTLVAKHGQRLQHRFAVKRRDDLAPRVDPLDHAAAQPARHQGRRKRRPVVPHVRAQAAADLEAVAKAVGGDQADPGALALEQRVGRDGRAVDQPLAVAQQRGGVPAECTRRTGNRIEHPFGGIARCAGRLERQDATALVRHHQIGEGAADVHADAQGRDERLDHGSRSFRMDRGRRAPPDVSRR